MVQLHVDLRDRLVRCRPLYELWENFGTLVCKEFGLPLHGMWFGMGWCVFFFIPIIIINVRLAKYFRRMKIRYYPEFLDDPNEGDYNYGYEDPPPSYEEIIGSSAYGRSPHDQAVEEKDEAKPEVLDAGDEAKLDLDKEAITGDIAADADGTPVKSMDLQLGTIIEEPDKETADALWTKEDDAQDAESETGK